MAETLSGYKVGQTVNFEDCIYGKMSGIISKIYRHYKTKETVIKIDHSNGDSYHFFLDTINQWN